MIAALLLAVMPPAGAVELSPRVGIESSFGDPFVVRRGVRAGLDVAPLEWFSLGVDGGWCPLVGESDLTALSRSLSARSVSPDVSRLDAHVGLYASVTPLAAHSGLWSSSLGLYGGVGVVHTVDDLEMLQAVGDPEAEATAVELHPSARIGLRGEVSRDRVVVGLRLERESYRELILSTTKEERAALFVGVDVGWRLSLVPPRRSAP